jgi:ABC-2 type transport system permease protein
MTTVTTPHPASAGSPREPGPGTDVSVARRAGDLLAAEWIKLWSVRSTYLALLAAAVATPAISLGVAHAGISYLQSGQPLGRFQIDPMATSFRGLGLAQLILGVLGALCVTSEFGSGLIRATFAATPRRGAVIAAKLVVIGAVTLVFGQIVVIGSFLGTQAVLAPVHVGLAITAPGVPRGLFGAGFYLAVVALVGLGIGAMVRHTAAAIATVVAVFFLIPQVAGVLPKPWSVYVADVMPSTAAQQISTLTPNPDLLTVGHAYAVLIAVAVMTPLAGAMFLHRRDA